MIFFTIFPLLLQMDDSITVMNVDPLKHENVEDNPWSVEDPSAFLKYCCPECDYKQKSLELFENHALENHLRSITLFGVAENFKDPLTSNIENSEQVDTKEGLFEVEQPMEVKGEFLNCPF